MAPNGVQFSVVAQKIQRKKYCDFVGTATTFRATHAFVAILTNNPELQKRLQREVDDAIGEETPRLVDKEKNALHGSGKA